MIAELWNDNIVWKILAQPWPLRLWILWLMAVNTAALLFWRQREARVVFGFWIANVVTMSLMYWGLGYVRLLGLSHVIWWTPMLLWLVPWFLRTQLGGAYAVWLGLLIVSDGVSLIIDYIDVVRYLFGDRAPG